MLLLIRIVKTGLSNCQKIAHLSDGSGGCTAPKCGGGCAECASEGGGKVAVTGESEGVTELGQGRARLGHAFKRGVQAQLGAVCMNGEACDFLEDAAKVVG